MDDMSMKMGLLELYELVGDNRQVTFYYDDLPGILVSIGFTVDYEGMGEEPPDDEDDEDEIETNDGSELVGAGTNGKPSKRKLH